jgi:AcrR family transcriptional regulator
MVCDQGGGLRALSRREHILEAARAVIEEFGSDAMTKHIAERAGLARPNVYRHFSSKDDLDFAVASSAHQELRAEVRTRLELCGSPLELIRAPIAAQVAWADSHPNLYRFVVERGYRWTSEHRTAEHAAFAAEITRAAAHYFPGFVADPDAADAVVTGLGGLIDASILRWLHRRTETYERLVDRLTSHTWMIIDDYLRGLGVNVDPAVPLPRTGETRSRD